MVPVYAAALLCLPNTQNWAFRAALLGAVIALITSYGLGLGWWTVEGANFSLGNRIYHGFIMSVLLLIALLVARDFTGGIRYGAIVIAVLTVYNVLNIEIGRTGYLQVTAVTFTYVALTFRRLQAVIVGLVVLIVLGVVYVSSDQVNHRVSQTLTNVENAIFEGGHASSSVGYRLDFYRGAIQIGADNPLGGVGVGDVVTELEDRANSGEMRFTTDNVHSEFLNMLVAGGLPALCLFLVFCLSMFWDGFRHRETNRITADSLIGISVIVAVSAIFNSTIKDYGEKHALLIILSLLVARLFSDSSLPKRNRAIPTPFKAQ